MKAVILAAGIGTRLNPITLKKPKCMVKVAGEPILAHQIRAYVNAGISEIIIVAGYKINQIKEYCKNIKYINIKIIENKYYRSTNNMYSLYLAKNEVSGNDFLLSNGDVVCDKEIIEIAVNNKSESLAFYDSDNYDEEELKLKISNNRAYSIEPKGPNKNNSNGSTIGIFTFNKEASILLFNDIKKIIEEKNLKNEWFEYSLSNIFKKTTFKPVDIKEFSWIEIDDYKDFFSAEKLFSRT